MSDLVASIGGAIAHATDLTEGAIADRVREYENTLDTLLTARRILDGVPEAIQRYIGDNHCRGLRTEGGIKTALKSRFWSDLLYHTSLYKLLSEDDKLRMVDQIHSGDVPEFTIENVTAYLDAVVGDIGTTYARKVYSAYKSVSRAHKTNDVFGFGKRLIIEGVVDNLGCASYGMDRLLEVLSCAIIAAGSMPNSRMDSALRSALTRESSIGRKIPVEGGAAIVQVFGNGNAHVWLHEEMRAKMNAALAAHMGTALPEARNMDYRVRGKRQKHIIERTLTPSERDALAHTYVYIIRDEEGVAIRWEVLTNDTKHLLWPYATGEGKNGTLLFDYDPFPLLNEAALLGAFPEWARKHKKE